MSEFEYKYCTAHTHTPSESLSVYSMYVCIFHCMERLERDILFNVIHQSFNRRTLSESQHGTGGIVRLYWKGNKKKKLLKINGNLSQ